MASGREKCFHNRRIQRETQINITKAGDVTTWLDHSARNSQKSPVSMTLNGLKPIHPNPSKYLHLGVALATQNEG